MFKRKKKAATEPEKPKNKTREEEIAEKLEGGAIRALITFELVGKPKKHIEDSLEKYLENIRKDARIDILNEETADAIEQDDGLFSTFSEVEMVINELNTLVWLAINFTPASVEILEPEKKSVSAPELNAWINDLLSRLHEIGMVHRDTMQKNIKLNESLNALIKNALVTALETGNHDAKELQKKLGIHQDQLKPFLEHLKKQGRIKQAGETYSLG